jgi:hypothetical protein
MELREHVLNVVRKSYRQSPKVPFPREQIKVRLSISGLWAWTPWAWCKGTSVSILSQPETPTNVPLPKMVCRTTVIINAILKIMTKTMNKNIITSGTVKMLSMSLLAA